MFGSSSSLGHLTSLLSLGSSFLGFLSSSLLGLLGLLGGLLGLLGSSLLRLLGTLLRLRSSLLCCCLGLGSTLLSCSCSLLGCCLGLGSEFFGILLHLSLHLCCFFLHGCTNLGHGLLASALLSSRLGSCLLCSSGLGCTFLQSSSRFGSGCLGILCCLLGLLFGFLGLLSSGLLGFLHFFRGLLLCLLHLGGCLLLLFCSFLLRLLGVSLCLLGSSSLLFLHLLDCAGNLLSALAFGSFLASFGVGSVCDRFLGLGCFIGSILEIRLQIVQLTRVKAILCQGVVVTPPILLDVFLRKHFLEELLLLGVKLATVCLRLRTCYSLSCPFHLGIHTLFSALQLPHRHLAGFSVRNDMCCSVFGSLGQMISMAGTNMLWARLACNWLH